MAVKRAKRHTHTFASDGIDVTPQSRKTEFVRFANRRAAAHERIENGYARKVMLLIESIFQASVLWQEAAQENTSKDRAKPFSPPFVNVVDRAVEFFPPAFSLGEGREEFERKYV